MHMAGALSVGLIAGWYRGYKAAARDIKKQAQERFLGHYWDEIMQSEVEYKKRANEAHKQAMNMQEQMRRYSKTAR
jgi:hypothetical protein